MKRAAIALAAMVGAVAGVGFWRARQPFEGPRAPVVVEIPRRMGAREMATLLAREGVIRDPLQFLFLRAIHPRANLQAGEYQFAGPASASAVFDKIVKGDVRSYEIRVPEGSNLWDVARAVGELGFLSEAEFRQAAMDVSLIEDLAPKAASLEGYLFPSTYRVTRHTTARQIARMMVDQFRFTWRKLGAPPHASAVVTLASLVEKETGREQERAIVSSVFHNRLNRGIRLDCDPTTIYAAMLSGRYRGTIYRSDLESGHPYNTYQHQGLPPGPIANPGEAALEAALHPAETNYIYFVAKPDGSGTHHFSATLAEHDRAVAEYRRGQQKINQGKPAKGVPGRSASANH